jgi:hypothetical protein
MFRMDEGLRLTITPTKKELHGDKDLRINRRNNV